MKDSIKEKESFLFVLTSVHLYTYNKSVERKDGKNGSNKSQI